MQNTRAVDAIVQYIERHLTQELTPEHIAEQHFLSLSQLYRDFYACTGHSVKEYIRKRRISNACETLKCSDMPLDIIAQDCGYQTQQAFHKQFKSIVGMTPRAYRDAASYFYFYPFTTNEYGIAVRVGTQTLPAWTMTRFYDTCLLGIEDKAIAALGAADGRVFGRNGKQLGNRFCYELMTERAEGSQSDLYATCVVDYEEQKINDGWNYLYNVWLSASMFEESGAGYFEEYLFQNGKPRRLKLYLPVKKRKAEQHIRIATAPEMVFVIARKSGRAAERRASEQVMTFLREQHPLLIRNARKFYVCAYDDSCACGVECAGALTECTSALAECAGALTECTGAFALPKGSGLELIHLPAGRYAVLPDDCLGDIRVGTAKLDLWLQNNSIAHANEPVFAVYESLNGSYDNENIHMQLFKRLQHDKNG